MTISAKPYREKTFASVKGNTMAYVEHGSGDAIVFQHGNPTSSYLWRNIMPYCEGLGRLIACDLIGMGDSDKLESSGPERYTYAEQRDYLFALWDQIGLGDKVMMVLHDWGSAMGFDWSNRNRGRVQGIVYMEAIVTPLTWADWPENAQRVFQGFRSESGEEMILEKNMFVERVLPSSIIRTLSDAEMAVYRKPFARPGEDRRPTLTWPRMIPNEGGGRLCRVARRSRHAKALHQCRSRFDTGWPAARALPCLAEPNRSNGERTPFPPRG